MPFMVMLHCLNTQLGILAAGKTGMKTPGTTNDDGCCSGSAKHWKLPFEDQNGNGKINLTYIIIIEAAKEFYV